MDHPGAVLIGVAVLWLFGRIMTACLHRDAIKRAMKQHHRVPPTPAQQTGRRLMPRRLLQYAAGVDSRLKLAAGIGVASITLSAAPGMILSWVGAESAIGKALNVTLRWALLAGIVHTLRKGLRSWRPSRAARLTADG